MKTGDCEQNILCELHAFSACRPQIRERQWLLNLEDSDKARRLMQPYWTKVLGAMEASRRVWLQLCQLCYDAASGFSL